MQDTEIQEFFARLTAQFEDCVALVAEGQHAGLSREEARDLLRIIRDKTTDMDASHVQIEDLSGFLPLVKGDDVRCIRT